jgi:P22 coat protein - gene protein 5.
MSIANFRPEIWSANLLVALRPKLQYGAFVNRDYEGEINQAGDTVRITSIGRPTVNTYVPNSTVITPEQVTDSQRTLVVDQAKYFAFGVDDVDQRQARGNVIPQAMDEAAFALASVIDGYIASAYTGVQAANALGAVAINSSTTPTDAIDKVIRPLKNALDKANVPSQGRTVVVTPDFYNLCLLSDARFVSNAAGNVQSALNSGVIGSAYGFNVVVSNVAPNPAGSQYAIIAGTTAAYTFAEQISKVEAYRPQSSFEDAVKGLTLFGGKLVRPDSWATALVTVS